MPALRSGAKLLPSLVLALGLAAQAAATDAIDAGRVRFRSAFTFAGQVHEAGRYEVQVVSSADGPVIVLMRDGQEALRELAIVQEAAAVRRPSASLVVVPKDDNRYRLTVREGAHRLLAFFEPA